MSGETGRMLGRDSGPSRRWLVLAELLTPSRQRPTMALALTLALATGARAQCARLSPYYGGSPWRGQTIGLLAGTGMTEPELRNAVGIWRAGCPAQFAARHLPELLVGARGDRTVTVERVASVSPHAPACAYFQGSLIRLWDWTYTASGVVRCAPAERIIAHELGHVLSLGDLPPWGGCDGAVMAQINPGSSRTTAIAPLECQVASMAFYGGGGDTREKFVTASRAVDDGSSLLATTGSGTSPGAPESRGDVRPSREPDHPGAAAAYPAKLSLLALAP
jgi:hypothetical protein